MKTFIRRPGNKSAHLRHIIPLIPKEFNTYIEPFVGTGSVFLHLLPEKWVINDLNKDIISIWKLVRDDPGYLLSQIDKFKKTFLPLDNENKLKVCKEITSNLDRYSSDKRTVMYLLMVYCCISGSIEMSNSFFFNSLYGHVYMNKSVHVFTEAYNKKIKDLSKILKKCKIQCKDYKEILRKAKKGDFVFIDPPYIEEKKYAFQYNKNESFDIENLKTELESLDKKGVKWLMTQIDNDLVRKTFSKYMSFNYLNKNCISKVKNSGKKEVIFMNY